ARDLPAGGGCGMTDVNSRKIAALERIREAEDRLRERKIPVYGDTKASVSPGLYLSLFHGFATDGDYLAVGDLGGHGPMIGPLKYGHTTYACDVKIAFIDEVLPTHWRKYGFDHEEQMISILKDGVIEFDGVYYGDWTVHVVPSP